MNENGDHLIIFFQSWKVETQKVVSIFFNFFWFFQNLKKNKNPQELSIWGWLLNFFPNSSNNTSKYNGFRKTDEYQAFNKTVRYHSHPFPLSFLHHYQNIQEMTLCIGQSSNSWSYPAPSNQALAFGLPKSLSVLYSPPLG